MTEFCFGNCADCPGIGRMVERDATLNEAEDYAIQAMCSDELDVNYAPDQYERFLAMGVMPGLPGASRPVESPEELAKYIRIQAAIHMKDIRAERDALRVSVEAATLDCPGPVQLRLQEAGRTVLATICGHPDAPQGDSIEPVRVNRS